MYVHSAKPAQDYRFFSHINISHILRHTNMQKSQSYACYRKQILPDGSLWTPVYPQEYMHNKPYAKQVNALAKRLGESKPYYVAWAIELKGIQFVVEALRTKRTLRCVHNGDDACVHRRYDGFFAKHLRSVTLCKLPEHDLDKEYTVLQKVTELSGERVAEKMRQKAKRSRNSKIAK